VGAAYQIAKSVSLAANATYQLSDLNGNGIKLVLDSGDFVAADCTAAIAVTVVYVAV
jgi:alkylated DNA repair dioxygenase AlkB